MKSSVDGAFCRVKDVGAADVLRPAVHCRRSSRTWRAEKRAVGTCTIAVCDYDDGVGDLIAPYRVVGTVLEEAGVAHEFADHVRFPTAVGVPPLNHHSAHCSGRVACNSVREGSAAVRRNKVPSRHAQAAPHDVHPATLSRARGCAAEPVLALANKDLGSVLGRNLGAAVGHVEAL